MREETEPSVSSAGKKWNRPTGSNLGDLARRYGEASALLVITIAIAIFFSLFPKTRATFPTLANVQATLGNLAVLAVVSLAALVPLVANQFDLSVGATLGIASVFSASAMAGGEPLAVAMIVALAIGAGVGLFNGLLVTRGRVTAVIATLGTGIVINGLVQWKTGGTAIVQGIPSGFASFGGGSTLAIPNVVYVMAALALLVSYFLGHTPYGRYLYAIGSNPTAARLVGVDTRLMLLLTFIIAGTLAAAGGILQVARSGSATPASGAAFTLPALAAAFLSAAAIKPGRYNVGGMLVAIVFLALLNSGLNLAGAASYINDVVNGIALILGVGLAAFLGRHRTA